MESGGPVCELRVEGYCRCEYENARLTIKYLFDISQTNGREIKLTDRRLAQNTKIEISRRLVLSHGFENTSFPNLLHLLAAEAVSDHYEAYIQDLCADIDGHLFSKLPQGGFEAQFVDLLTDSVTYFMGKRCGLPDEDIPLGNGMETIHHSNTLPLVGRLGNAVTSISKNALLEIEHTIKIVNKERTENHEKAIGGTELLPEGRHNAAEHPSIQQSGERPATGAVRQAGAGISQAEPSAAVYDFENGWHSDGENAPSQRGSSETDRGSHAADASKGADVGYRGHAREDETSQQPAAVSRGNRPPRLGAKTEVSPSPTEQNTEKESSQDGSFFAPFSLTDEQVRRNCEFILTSTGLYPPELYRTVRSLYEQDGSSPEQKATSLGKIYSTYGDKEYQDDVYLAAVMDLYSGKIVGWAMDKQMTQNLVTDALKQAVGRIRPPRGVVLHSDRGVQYACKAYRNLIGRLGFIQSMSRKGNCWDNAPMESIFGTLKTELVYHEDYKTRAEARISVLDYIETLYNSIRLQEKLGYLSPNDFETLRKSA